MNIILCVDNSEKIIENRDNQSDRNIIYQKLKLSKKYCVVLICVSSLQFQVQSFPCILACS